MSVAKAIEIILTDAGLDSLVKAIRIGSLKAREIYPLFQINDFSVPEHCKDGFAEKYTVTVISWASTQSVAEGLANQVRNLLVDVNSGIYSDVEIRWIKFEGRGPWLNSGDERHLGRPLDFEIHINI